MKKTFYSEIAYIFGIVFLAFGTALMEKADFGMSMVVAPAYILHLKISETYAAFTFGTSEYLLQLFLIAILSLILRKFKLRYLFSFVTAVIYGVVLDLFIYLLHNLPAHIFSFRCIYFLAGMIGCAIGVAFFFKTYFAPEAYELIVKEITQKTGKSITKVKTTYDLTSLGISVILSFVFFGFGKFIGVNIGTLVTALCNGWIIGKISDFLDHKFDFKDIGKFRTFFEA